MMRLHWENTKKRRQKIKGYDTEAAKQANDRENRMHKKDMLKFAHQNAYGSDQVRQRLVSFWTNHFTMGGFESRELSIDSIISCKDSFPLNELTFSL